LEAGGIAVKEPIGGPFIQDGEYVHGIWCSGSYRHPRRQGNTCSCYRSDLYYRRLGLIFNREAGTVKRTLWVGICPGCTRRWEFPFTEEAIPLEVYCQTCSSWIKVEEVSWEGTNFADALPVFPRKF
jgi:hypothetical protein